MRTDALEDGDMTFAGAWREHRPLLVDLAFRMLGNIGDAEDVVQDAFSRLLAADPATIEDVRGWLVVVVSRLCLDILRSARVRRAAPSPELGIERVAVSSEGIDPADRVTFDDHVQMALLVVLESLSPPERAVFVLHDVFRYPFDRIATIVGRSPDACRKLASRARRRIDASGGTARFGVEPAEHRRIAEQFVAACGGGDLEALMQLLDADVSGEVDLGLGPLRAPPQHGRDRVARNTLLYFGASSRVTLVSCALDGWPGVLAFKDDRLYAIAVLESAGGLIHSIHASRNPRTLGPIGRIVEARRG